MFKNILKYLGGTILVLFVVFNLILGYFGTVSILLTCSFYIAITFIALILIKLFVNSKELSKNISLFVITSMFSLLIVEFTLKYVVKSYVTYPETNGDFFYTSQYRMLYKINLARRYGLTDLNPSLFVREPNTEREVGKLEFSYRHNYNDLGLRVSKTEGVDSGKLIVACLGDSFTEGVGAPNDSTWPQLLENKFNAENLNQGNKLYCLNGGSDGSDPFFELIILKKLLLKYKPQTVILAVNNSDIDDAILRGGWERFKENGEVHFRKPPWWEYLYQFSYITRNIVHSFWNINWMLLTPKQEKVETRMAISSLNDVITKQYLSLAEEYKFKLVVILHPMQYELEGNTFDELNLLNQQLLEQDQIVTINLFEEFKKEINKTDFEFKDFYWKTDRHHNSKGYQLWADILYKEVFEVDINSQE